MNSICFTKLKTVIFDNYELTNDLFLKRMKEVILYNVDAYNVSYDKENDRYQIVYNSKVYDVLFRNEELHSDCQKKEIIELLNSLVDYSEKTRIRKEKERESIQEEAKIKADIFDNVRAGISNTNELKKGMITLEENEFKEDKFPVLKGIWKIIKNFNYGEVPEERLYWEIGWNGIIALVLTMILGIFQLRDVIFIPGGLYIVSAFDGLSCIAAINNGEKGYRGILLSLLSIITLPFNIAYNIVRRIGNVITHKKKIRELKKGIAEFKEKKRYLPKKKVNINEVTKLLEDITTSDNKLINYNSTVDVIEELRNSILLIKDEKLNRKYSIELYEIIKYYIEASKRIKYEKTTKILFEQVSELRKKVDKELIKEQEEEKANNDYNALMDEVKHQKSIGTR